MGTTSPSPGEEGLLRRYALTAILLLALAAALWTLAPHSSRPLGPYLGRVALTAGGPVSLWIVRGFPWLDLSTVAFVLIAALVQGGVLLARRLPARFLGYLGILSWFLVGAVAAGRG